MASKIQIISDAFVNLGKAPVSSPQTDNPIFAAASGIYDRLVVSVLTMHPWRFAMKTFELNKLTETSPYDEWNEVFLIPGDVLLAYRTRPVVNFEIFGDRLYTNEIELSLDYIFQASEADFPAYFTDLMILQLSARIAMTVTQLPDLAAFWDKESTRQLVVAKFLDSSTMPNPSIIRNEIFSSHFALNSRGRGR